MFDKTQEYTKRIEPVLKELNKICSEEGMPMFFTVCVKDDERGSEYRQDLISPTALGIELADSKTESLMNVIRGFRTIPPHKDDDFEIEFVATKE